MDARLPLPEFARPMTRKPRTWAIVLVSAIAVLGGAAYLGFARDTRATAQRLAAGSNTIETSYGRLQYAVSGSGPAVLAIHGAGGGYDQGNLMVGAFGADGFRWITVSRFGYLGSALPADASTVAQADAFAELLDGLGIKTTAVLAMSGGVPPALQFAARHPDRTTALVLLSSAPYTPLPTQAQDLPVPIWVYNLLFSSDFPYWLLQKTARGLLAPVFDATPQLRAQMTPAEAAFLDGMIDAFQPVTARLDGLRNEGAALDPGARYNLGAITAPTLVIHARDDGLNPARIAEYTAANIANAELMLLDSGGHLLLTHHAKVRAATTAFLRTHTSP